MAMLFLQLGDRKDVVTVQWHSDRYPITEEIIHIAPDRNYKITGIKSTIRPYTKEEWAFERLETVFYCVKVEDDLLPIAMRE